MSDSPSQPEADAAQEEPQAVTGSAPQQAEAPGTSVLPDGVSSEGVVSPADVVAPDQSVAADEPAPLEADDAER